MKKVRSYARNLPGIVHQVGETLGLLFGHSALSMCYRDARYSKLYILETVSDLGNLPEDREAHPKSCVWVGVFCCFILVLGWGFFGHFGRVKEQ